MAVNPELTTLVDGGLTFPTPFVSEDFLAERSGIVLELTDLPFQIGNPKSWRGRGRVVLSDIRAVFIADNQAGELRAFDLPLVYVQRVEYNQPILFCNNIGGEVWSAVAEGGPSGAFPPIRFKLCFTDWGFGSFARLFNIFCRRARTLHVPQRSAAADQQKTPAEIVATAMVDPNDPTKLYLTQPVPSAPPMPAPAYARGYGRDEVYEPMM